MLYKETVESATLDLLIKLLHLKPLSQFRLAGGTALSLLLGHRSSIDLDLFTDEPFTFEEITDSLSNEFPTFYAKEKKSSRLLFTNINNVKVDFVHTFERFRYPVNIVDDIRLASLEEIIALKLNAVAGRGAKKDFWDLHELMTMYPFEQMMQFYYERYPNNSPMMVLKSITYFVDADTDEDPICFKKRNWEHIKQEILRQVNTYLKK